MSTAKEMITQTVQAQPDDATYEEIMQELAFERMIENGLEDSRKGRVIANEAMERQILSWKIQS